MISISIAALVFGLSFDDSVARRLAAAVREPPNEACSRIETLLSEDLTEADRRACLRTLRDLLPRGTLPPSEAELSLIAECRTRSLPAPRLLVGRYVLVIATDEFARGAEESHLLPLLDLAYIELRDFFGVDAAQKIGRRFILYPERDKPDGYSIHSPSLRVSIGRAFAASGGWSEGLVHEISHGPGWHHPARHLFGGGIFEGWADLAPAYVAERLAFLGPPFAGRFEWFAKDLEGAGHEEFLRTRLPIEEIIAYRPSGSLLLALAFSASSRPGEPDWRPFRRLFHEHAKTPLPALPGYLWPALFARDVLRTFPRDRAFDVLSLYRFPLDPASQNDVDDRLQKPRSPGSFRKDETVLRNWKVLGPIPDPTARRLEFDPIDGENFVEKEEYVIDGKTYRWRTDVAIDERGVVALSTLPGGNDSAVFYLLGKIRKNEPPPVTFFVASDDEAAVWLDGERIYEFRGERGTWPDEPDRVFGRASKDGGHILALVSNHGGPAGFHLRWSSEDPFTGSLRTESRSSDERRRLAAVRYVATRRVPAAFVLDLLQGTLDDRSPSVRLAAVQALAVRRNEPRVIRALIDRWSSEHDKDVLAAVGDTLETLTFIRHRSHSDARAWWSESSRSWNQSDFVECEDAISAGSFGGGFFGTNAGALANQCVDRGWGVDSNHWLSFVLDSREGGARRLSLRYACAAADARVSIRVRRAQRVVVQRDDVSIPRTENGSAWRWLDVPIGKLESGRYHVELFHPSGSPVLDVIGFRPES